MSWIVFLQLLCVDPTTDAASRFDASANEMQVERAGEILFVRWPAICGAQGNCAYQTYLRAGRCSWWAGEVDSQGLPNVSDGGRRLQSWWHDHASAGSYTVYELDPMWRRYEVGEELWCPGLDKSADPRCPHTE